MFATLIALCLGLGCEEPASHLERCTQPERMVFRFSACPDVRGSESGGE